MVRRPDRSAKPAQKRLCLKQNVFSFFRNFFRFLKLVFVGALACVRPLCLLYLPGGGPWGSLTRAIKVYKCEAQLSIKLTGWPAPTRP